MQKAFTGSALEFNPLFDLFGKARPATAWRAPADPLTSSRGHASEVVPVRPIDYCLKQAGLKLADVDCFAYGSSIGVAAAEAFVIIRQLA